MNGPVPTGFGSSVGSAVRGGHPRRAAHHARLRGQIDREHDPRPLHRDRHRHRVGQHDLGCAVRIRRDVGKHLAGEERVELTSDVVHHRRAVERRAVVERHALAGHERPHGVVLVGRDRLREVRDDLPVLGDGGESVEDAADGHVARRRARELRRHPGAAGVGLDAHDELAALHRREVRRRGCARAALRGCARAALRRCARAALTVVASAGRRDQPERQQRRGQTETCSPGSRR